VTLAGQGGVGDREETMKDTITVRGTARRRVAPDVGVWQAVVEARGADERQAYAACATRLTAVHAAVDAVAATAEVSAGGVQVHAEWSESGQRRIGCIATASVGIRAPLDRLETLGQTAMDAGAVRLDGPSYEVSGVLVIMDELGAEAVVSAHVRASALAAAARRGVGQVVSIVDGVDDPGAGRRSGPFMAMRAEAMDVGPVSPESQVLQADVTVTYLLV
jgi:uncharacterized protein YggE